MLCTDLTLVNHHKWASRAIPLRCKRWSCEFCQPLRRRQVIRDVCAGKPDKFLTLTVNPEVGASPDHRARMLVANWKRLRRRICKVWGFDQVPFFAVLEAHKSGEPHLHLALRCGFISIHWLKAEWERLTAAHQVWIERLRGKRHAAKYLGKYLGKELHRFEGCKRYWHGGGYKRTRAEEREEREAENGRWEVVDEDWRSFCDRMCWGSIWLGVHDGCAYFVAGRPP